MTPTTEAEILAAADAIRLRQKREEALSLLCGALSIGPGDAYLAVTHGAPMLTLDRRERRVVAQALAAEWGVAMPELVAA